MMILLLINVVFLWAAWHNLRSIADRLHQVVIMQTEVKEPSRQLKHEESEMTKAENDGLEATIEEFKAFFPGNIESFETYFNTDDWQHMSMFKLPDGSLHFMQRATVTILIRDVIDYVKERQCKL